MEPGGKGLEEALAGEDMMVAVRVVQVQGEGVARGEGMKETEREEEPGLEEALEGEDMTVMVQVQGEGVAGGEG